jgi:hypothetical protein
MMSENVLKLLVRDINFTDLTKLKKFKCRDGMMEHFLIKEAYYYHINGEGITKLVVNPETGEIAGYYTLKCDAIKIEDLEMREDPIYVPCIEVSRIAVSTSLQSGSSGIHIGTHLMGYIIRNITNNIASQVGCRFITLHAIRDRTEWYSREFGFERIEDEKSDECGKTVYMCLDITDKAKVTEYINFVAANKK